MKNSRPKHWKFPVDNAPSTELIEIAEGSEVLATLIKQRGIAGLNEARAFLDPEKYTPSSPMEFADMPKAIVRISQAIVQKEKIIVYGDYDVDGVTATSVVLTVLKKLGANVEFYIPNRATEGYGLNLKAVSILASKHRAKLIISCDCGISNFSEINLAKSLGVETIIVDHHSMPEVLPPAHAILHPKQFDEEHPLFHLPGVGVAYKLCEALLLDNNMPEEVAKLHDFVTLGMIADMVPLVKENRYLVQIGLPALAKSERAGIRALLDQTNRMDGTDIVGFALAPRINAVGRLSDASLAVQLMTVEDEAEAVRLAKQLETENARRQELCEQIFFEADLKAKAALTNSNDKALAIYASNWHHGVVGIVASRLVEKYHCPVFIAELDEAEGKIKGSARGIPGIDLYQVLKANEQLMTKWGGHQMAAGFSAELQYADTLCKALVQSCNAALAQKSMQPVLDIDLELLADKVDLPLAKLLSKLGPFGMWNKKPVLVVKNLTVAGSRPLGKEGKHHRLNLKDSTSGSAFEAVFWRSTGRVPEDGTVIDLAFNPEVNVFNKTERLQLVLSDWRPAGQTEEELAAQIEVVPEVAQTEPSKQKIAVGSGSASSAQVQLETTFDGTKASTRIAQTAESESEPEQLEQESFAPPAMEEAAPPETISAQVLPARQIMKINWKDLREHSSPQSVLESALKKLGDKVCVFAEAADKIPNVVFQDRLSLEEKPHLLIWEYPCSFQLFKTLLTKAQASNIYLVGAVRSPEYDANSFLKKLLGIIRFAVNQREGQAQADKIAIAMSSNKMSVALGLTILKKANVLDWYAEDGILFLDILGTPTEPWDNLPEFRQLNNCLKEIIEFRRWAAESSLAEIQLALVPNAIRINASADKETVRTGHNPDEQVNSNDRTTFASSHERGKV